MLKCNRFCLRVNPAVVVRFDWLGQEACESSGFTGNAMLHFIGVQAKSVRKAQACKRSRTSNAPVVGSFCLMPN